MLVALTFARGICAEGGAGATPEESNRHVPIGGTPTTLYCLYIRGDWGTAPRGNAVSIGLGNKQRTDMVARCCLVVLRAVS